VLWRAAAGAYADLIEEAALRYGLDPALLTAMAQTESAFNPAAVSPKGAAGLLQLMPATAERFGVRDVFDVPQNVEGAAKYLKWLLERFEGRTELALAGYNAGEGTVDRYQGIPPYRETRDYVARVLDGVRGMTRLAP
jgi:soluble lytic murein transglycosylase-like protein